VPALVFEFKGGLDTALNLRKLKKSREEVLERLEFGESQSVI